MHPIQGKASIWIAQNQPGERGIVGGRPTADQYSMLIQKPRNICPPSPRIVREFFFSVSQACVDVVAVSLHDQASGMGVRHCASDIRWMAHNIRS